MSERKYINYSNKALEEIYEDIKFNLDELEILDDEIRERDLVSPIFQKKVNDSISEIYTAYYCGHEDCDLENERGLTQYLQKNLDKILAQYNKLKQETEELRQQNIIQSNKIRNLERENESLSRNRLK